MVEGRMIFGSILISMGSVILAVILGLRYLAGTLWGSDTLNTLTLVLLYVVLVVVTTLYSFTEVFARVLDDDVDGLHPGRGDDQRHKTEKPGRA